MMRHFKDLIRHKGRITFTNSMEVMQAHHAKVITVIKDTTRITNHIHKDMERRKVLKYYIEYNPQSNYGMRTPGAGKVVLAGLVSEEALKKSTATTPSAFSFCDYKNDKTHDIETILREEAYTKLEQHYQAHHSRGCPRYRVSSHWVTFFRKWPDFFNHVFLTVDGIYECGTCADEVLEALMAIMDATENISMALLSRDEENIRDWFEEGCVSVEIAADREDVSEYVRAQLGDRIRRRRLRLDDPELKEEILEKLEEGAKGIPQHSAVKGAALSPESKYNTKTQAPLYERSLSQNIAVTFCGSQRMGPSWNSPISLFWSSSREV
ncbi:hypothetical protein PG993_009196 [Apiospora rasikravindrae]|uniref:Nephrocystin 3-like N-terminal domain-containing protein n=1 Tax=Apiospora rasikravindrae TaxID=990691 RepID=A0ABR1SIN9_9PEZI